MKTTPRQNAPRATPVAPSEHAQLRARLADAEATLRAIRTGEVDSVMVDGKEGSQVFTLDGAEQAYRVLIESMNEGALTLTTEKVILYANQCFARMVKCPLEQVTGGSFRRFLTDADRAMLRPLMKQAANSGAKILVQLIAADGSQRPVQISICRLPRNGSSQANLSMVVTDLTEARWNEEMLRALTHRVVQVQEAERGRVALELHDNITQLLCAIVFRSQALADKLSARAEPLKQDALKLRELLGQAAEEVERISRNLRPSILDHLGLVAVLTETSKEFAARTGVAVKLACTKMIAQLLADTELTLYRILQEALKNVEQHARARHVTVTLRQTAKAVQLVIHDDGIGFDTGHHPAKRKEKGALGLLSMRERAAYVGGTLKVNSAPGQGTTIHVQVPFASGHRDPGVPPALPTPRARAKTKP